MKPHNRVSVPRRAILAAGAALSALLAAGGALATVVLHDVQLSEKREVSRVASSSVHRLPGGRASASHSEGRSPFATAHALATTVVRPGSLDGWDQSNYDFTLNLPDGDKIGSATTARGTYGAFVNGPGSPPSGTGSYFYSVGDRNDPPSGDDAARLRTANYDGLPLDQITTLDYWTYETEYGSGDQAVYIQLRIDQDGDGGTDDILFFEPVYQTGAYSMINNTPPVPNQGTLALLTWQHWDAEIGGWWSANESAGGPPLIRLSEYIAEHPGAKLATDVPSIRLTAGFGGGAWAGFRGNVDAFTINSDTYDFEGPPTPTSTTLDVAPAKTNYGDKVTLTATVSPNTATGTVEFVDQNAGPTFFQGFETDNSGWDVFGNTFPQYNATRVSSGTNGVTSKTGSYHAEAGQYDLDNDGGSAATDWGAPDPTVFPPGGYSTTIDIYLDCVYASTAGDQRIDWDSAISDNNGDFLSDFVFNMGTEPTGFVITAGNNAGRSGANPADPGHDPIHVTQTGWYTFKHRFYNDGNVLACDLSIIDPNGNVLVGGPAWTRRNPNHVITSVGGPQYGWFAAQEMPFLAFDNSTLREAGLGSATLVNGQATLSVTGLAVGEHTFVATYTGDDYHAGSSSAKVSHEVNITPTTTSLTSDVNPAKPGEKVNLTAHVEPADPTGTVEFFDGAASLGTAPVDANGDAILSQMFATVGDHDLTASYSGDASHEPSTSPSYTETILGPPTVTVVFPSGPALNFLVGSDVKIAWTTDEPQPTPTVSIFVSRDNGTTYTPIAIDTPNDGSYIWTVDPPGTNTGAAPEFTALIRIVAKDVSGEIGEDTSDNPFSIYDLATPAVVTKLETFAIDGGVQVKWALGVRGLFQTVELQRSDDEAGPWLTVAADVTQEADVTVAVDKTAKAGQSYWYRLLGTTPQGVQASLGTVQGTAGSPREFSLRAAWPNPMQGSGMTTEFAVSRLANISLLVHDLQGRTIATLAKGQFAPGRYQVKWDGRGDNGAVPAGVYFLRFTTPEKVYTGRLVVQ